MGQRLCRGKVTHSCSIEHHEPWRSHGVHVHHVLWLQTSLEDRATTAKTANLLSVLLKRRGAGI